jgi:predicted deacetylase
MNWDVWAEVERILIEMKLSPLLAVVPANLDPDLELAPAHPDFWGEVRKWRDWGWTIALHGYRHQSTTREPGVVGINPKSEFAGLDEEEQHSMLQRATKVFREEGVTPDVWVAPWHSFDQATLSVLKQLGIQVISDGLAVWPHRDANALLWIPQQLWRFHWRPFGVWTVCYHHNRWSESDISAFRHDVRKYRERITDVPSVAEKYCNRHGQLSDGLYGAAHLAALSLRRRIRAAE